MSKSPDTFIAMENATDVPEGMYKCRQVLWHKTYPIGRVYCCVDCGAEEVSDE